MKAQDPVASFRKVLLGRKILTENLDSELEAQAREQVEDSIAFAEAAPYPDVTEASYPVFAEDIRHA